GQANQEALALKKFSQLSSTIKRELICVRVRTASAICAGSRLPGREASRITPVVRSSEVRSPTAMRQKIVVVGGIHRHRRHDAPHVVQANCALGRVYVPGQHRQNDQNEQGDGAEDGDQLRESEGPFWRLIRSSFLGVHKRLPFRFSVCWPDISSNGN